MTTKPFVPNDIEVSTRRMADQKVARHIRMSGSGAVAQDGGDALGEGSVKVEGDAKTIVTGTLVVTNYCDGSTKQHFKEQIGQSMVAYLRWLRSRTESIELRGIERAGAQVVQVPLETAYVPLRARWVPRFNEVQQRTNGQRGLYPVCDADTNNTEFDERDISLNQVLGWGYRLVITGGPGSGKTTVLRHIAWALSESLLTGESEPVRMRLGLETDPGALPLPIIVPLASFARYRRELPATAPAQATTLAHFISHYLISRQADFNLPTDFFVKLLNDGRDVLLLLDGLDEVPSESERVEVRQSVDDLVSGREAMRVVVTCRTVAFRSLRTPLVNFREIAVQPPHFDQHIAPMVRQAYTCIHPHDAALRAERVEDLLDRIRRLEEDRRARLGKDAEAFANSPLMVRLLLIVHVNNRTIPDERADLFDKAIKTLLQVDYGQDEKVNNELSADWKLFLDMAQHLAHHMHVQGDDHGREIEEWKLKEVLNREPEFAPHLDEFLRHTRQRGSVLAERNNVYYFIHLAFQEFLAARYLREVIGEEGGRDAILDFLKSRLENPWWREPILLLAGYLAGNAVKAANGFLRALVAAGDTWNAQFSAAELAGASAVQWPKSGKTLRKDCAQRILDLLCNTDALMDSKSVVRRRAEDTLTRLEDPRFEARRFYLPADKMLGFVLIPADPGFKIGTRKSDVERVRAIINAGVPDEEVNDNATPTPMFYIARYAVTVAQFRAFVEAKVCEVGSIDGLRDLDSRPVRVSWYDAANYCDWLNEMLGNSSALEGSAVASLIRDGRWRVALPSELEWEKAARGALGNVVFPWGDDPPDPARANYCGLGFADTTPVGCFPANGFNLYDMSGNLWEWTHSAWDEDLTKPNSGYGYKPNHTEPKVLDEGYKSLRVARGGSWASNPSNMRCTCRIGFRPDSWSGYVGFRVVLRSLH